MWFPHCWIAISSPNVSLPHPKNCWVQSLEGLSTWKWRATPCSDNRYSLNNRPSGAVTCSLIIWHIPHPSESQRVVCWNRLNRPFTVASHDEAMAILDSEFTMLIETGKNEIPCCSCRYRPCRIPSRTNWTRRQDASASAIRSSRSGPDSAKDEA